MKTNEKIKNLRLQNNMSLDQLANALNIDIKELVKIEQGIIKPNIDILKEISTIFNVLLSNLVENEKDPIAEKKAKTKKIGYISFLVVLAFTIFSLLISFVMLKIMDDVIPIHFDLNWNVTRYGLKYESLVLPGSNILFFSICLAVYLFSKKNPEYESSIIVTNVVLLLTIIIFTIMNFVLGFNSAKNITNDLTPALISMMYALFIVLHIFILPTFNKTNKLFGFRTTLTLKNENAWEKINYFYGISGIIASSIAFVLSLIIFNSSSLYLILLIFINMIPSIIYHEKIRKEYSNT